MTKRPRGRPKKDDALPNPITVRLPSGISDFIDQTIRERSDRDQPDKAQVIREMLVVAMDVAKRKK